MNNERRVVTKFGGSSIANAQSIGLVIGIMENDPRRRAIVVSAPGIDSGHNIKVTDLLLDGEFDAFQERMHQLGRDLGWVQRDRVIAGVMADIYGKPFKDFRASRGEYVTAKMLADLTGSRFIDSRDILRITIDRDRNRTVARTSYPIIEKELNRLNGAIDRVIIPGFYGKNWRGWVMTLPRDGSDISGAAVARGLRAQIYEIFSDTNGIMTADPNQNPDAAQISNMNYEQFVALGGSVAKAIHPQVLRILRSTGIIINYRNTFKPDHPGTRITAL